MLVRQAGVAKLAGLDEGEPHNFSAVWGEPFPYRHQYVAFARSGWDGKGVILVVGHKMPGRHGQLPRGRDDGDPGTRGAF
jgi:hypothetical protein